MGIIKEKLEELDRKEPDVSHSIESVLMDYMGKDHHFCGCGAPGEAYKYLRDVLNLVHDGNDDGWERKFLQRKEYFKDMIGVEYFTYYMIDNMGLTEHAMMKVKQAFREAKEEQIKASYDLWEKMDEEMPRLEEKVKQAIRRVEPFIETLEKANNLIRSINTYQFERFFEQVSEIDRIYKENPGIFDFMMKHYKGE